MAVGFAFDDAVVVVGDASDAAVASGSTDARACSDTLESWDSFD